MPHSSDSESLSDDPDVERSEVKQKITTKTQTRVQRRSSPPTRKGWVPPQKSINSLWARFSPRIFSNVTTVSPTLRGVRRVPLTGKGALMTADFEEAAEACKQKVKKIVEEHRKANRRYRDPHFDIDLDHKRRQGKYLTTLTGPDPFEGIPGEAYPQSVKRIHKIFNGDQTFKPGSAKPDDIRQGKVGNCWLIASLTALATMPEMIARICVEHDADIGVYGFLFFRDGEWIHSIIDDSLYLSGPDWDTPSLSRFILEQVDREYGEEEHRRVLQTGSQALWAGHCKNKDETWLPLLEKAYAKAHGDYQSLDGGWSGEGLEDLTGGVTTEIVTSDILDEDEFWNLKLKKVSEEFLFSCAYGVLDAIHWKNRDRQGIEDLHAYTIIKATELKATEQRPEQRLLLIRNPWGKLREKLWKGAWSDGSKEWTPETLKELDHQQGVDSVFWISYQELLSKFEIIEETRLFRDPAWCLAQQWTSIDVPWSADYIEKFRIKVHTVTDVVVVLSQLDDRYFKGLDGQYRFKLKFRVHPLGTPSPENYIARNRENAVMNRSVVVDLPQLQPGTYSIFAKVLAERYVGKPSVEQVVEEVCRNKTHDEKFLQVGHSYNQAHAKGANHTEAQLEFRMREEEKRQKKRWKLEHKGKKKGSQRAKKKIAKKKKRGIVNSEDSKAKSPTNPPSQEVNISGDTAILGDDLPASTMDINLQTDTAQTSTMTNIQPGRNVTSSSQAIAPTIILDTTIPVEQIDRPVNLNRNKNQEPVASRPGPATVDQREYIVTQRVIIQSSDDEDGGNEGTTAESSEYYIHTDTEPESDDEIKHENLLSRMQRFAYDGPFEDDQDVGLDANAWNASCIIGLRVCSKDPNLSVKVVLPGEGKKTGLDIDDKGAGMSLPIPTEVGKGKSEELPLKIK